MSDKSSFFAELRRRIVPVATGFPIALVIAWAFESTSHGIERTLVADALNRHSRGRAWIYVAVIGAVCSVSLFFIGKNMGRHSPISVGVADQLPVKSIAVLPFENLSDDKGAAYFADGIQDQILTKLASIAFQKLFTMQEHVGP